MFFSGRSTSPIRSFQDLRPCENHLLRCDARGFCARSFVNGGFVKKVYPQTIFMALAILNIYIYIYKYYKPSSYWSSGILGSQQIRY